MSLRQTLAISETLSQKTEREREKRRGDEKRREEKIEKNTVNRGDA
jgi:hypothetical protein